MNITSTGKCIQLHYPHKSKHKPWTDASHKIALFRSLKGMRCDPNNCLIPSKSVVSNCGPGGQKWPQRIREMARKGFEDFLEQHSITLPAYKIDPHCVSETLLSLKSTNLAHCVSKLSLSVFLLCLLIRQY